MEKKNFQIMKDLLGYFKPGQIKKMYNAADNIRDKVLIRMLWKSGRRIGEVLQVKVHDIDFENPAIIWHIEKKTKKKQGVRVKWDKRLRLPLDDFTFRLLKFYIKRLALRNQDYIFFSPMNDKAISRQRADQIIKRVAYSVGITSVGSTKPHCHHFRHTFATEGAKKLKTPADIVKLQKWLDHANLGITQEYLQFNPEELKDLLED